MPDVRVECVRTRTDPVNWIFLPGGPGLGSESLKDLIHVLYLENYQISGNVWLLDLPGDGSNTTSDNAKSFQYWQPALIEAIETVKEVKKVS